MAYQPTFPSPYMEAIDVTQEGGNIFKCLINPKDTILDASIKIYYNNRDDIIVRSGQTTGAHINNKYVIIPYDPYVYNDLSARLKNRENLTIYINSESRKIIRVEDLGSNTGIYIYVDTWFGSVANSTYDYSIYTNTLITTHLPDSLFPFVGGLSDSSWLTCSVDDENLKNKRDYKWSITLTFDEVDNVDSGYINGVDTTSSIIYIPFNDSLITRLLDGGVYYVTVNSERVKIINIAYSYGVSINLYLETPFSTTPTKGDIYDIDTNHVILTSPEYYFKARTNPVVTFDVPEIINSSSHTFSAIYSQDQKVGVAYFQYDLLKNGIEIASSGKVFTQNITHTFDNLVNDTAYNILLTIVNNDGVEIHEERTFKAEYPIMASTVMPVLSLDNDIGRISVDFDNNASIPSTLIGTTMATHKIFGVVNETPNYTVISSGKILEGSSDSRVYIEHYANIEMGMYIKIGEETIKIRNYRHQDDNSVLLVLLSTPQEEDLVGLPYEILSYFNGIHLEENESILWDTISDNPLVLPDNSSQVVHWHGTHGFNGVILEKINSDSPLGSTVVSYDGMNFSYKLGTEDVVNFCPYTGFANAIAGRDEHSTTDIVLGYDPSSLTVTVSETALATVGNCIQINKECRTITSVVVDGNFSIITIDRAFKTPPSTENEYVIYDENYLYILSESDEISDGDILIDNDLSYKYWWLIVLLPNEVQFIKTVPFLEITQIESEV